MNVAVTGSSGLIGSALVRRLQTEGHQVTRVVRSRDAATGGAIFWDPAADQLDHEGLAGLDAVVNLAGENILGVWTDEKKKRLRQSRVGGTDLLARGLARIPEEARPRVLVNASAVGYYGHRPSDDALDESAQPGTGFFPDLVQDWERATAPAAEIGVRVAMTRFGVVLDPGAPLLKMTDLATRLGFGAVPGSGDQVVPWVTRSDVVSAIRFAMDEGLEGPVNVVAPARTTAREYADTLARVLDRPRRLRIPAPMIRLAGQLGDEVLRGAWVVPAKLEAAGFEWRDRTLEAALRRLLDR